MARQSHQTIFILVGSNNSLHYCKIVLFCTCVCVFSNYLAVSRILQFTSGGDYIFTIFNKHLRESLFFILSLIFMVFFAGFVIYTPGLLLTLDLSRWWRLLVHYQHQSCSDGPLCYWRRSQCHPYHQVAHAWQGGSNWFMVNWMDNVKKQQEESKDD